jgi:hypothetical protein
VLKIKNSKFIIFSAARTYHNIKMPADIKTYLSVKKYFSGITSSATINL